jgi:hypothetical protein
MSFFMLDIPKLLNFMYVDTDSVGGSRHLKLSCVPSCTHWCFLQSPSFSDIAGH